jgi:hypothetical protein
MVLNVRLFLPILPDINMSRFNLFLSSYLHERYQHSSSLRVEHSDFGHVIRKCIRMFCAAAGCSLMNVKLSKSTASVGLRELPNYVPCQRSLNSQQANGQCALRTVLVYEFPNSNSDRLYIRAKTISCVHLGVIIRQPSG